MGAILLLLLPLLAATPAGAFEFIRIGDPDNPPDTTPPATTGTTGLCANETTVCRTHADCTNAGAPTPCTNFPWPEEYQERGDVPYLFDIARLPVSVADWAAYLNATGRDPRSVALTGLSLPVPPSGTRTIPPLLTGTTGAYVALLPDFPWPYADRDHAMRYVNWLGDGDETWGSYDCTGLHCDPDRLPGAKFFLPTLHEWRKAATWDPFAQTWWVQPGNGGAEPEPGVDANVASAPGWGTGIGNCNAGTQYPLAECELVPNGSYPHYQTPWGVEDMCGNGAEISESCGEFLGEISCSQMIMNGIHPWFPSTDCLSTHFQQAPAYGFNYHGTAIRVARRASRPSCGLLGAEVLLPCAAWAALRRRGRSRTTPRRA